MAQETDLTCVVLEAFGTLAERRFTVADFDLTFEEIGADSLALQQVLMVIEDRIERTLSDATLEALTSAATLGDVHRLLASELQSAA